MHLEYKEYKFSKPRLLITYCGDCGERLKGNNNDMFPYKCSCGTWEVKFGNSPMLNFKLNKS